MLARDTFRAAQAPAVRPGPGAGATTASTFSESHFKTMKYQPQFPQRFGCIQDAKAFCRSFFDWYNQEHHHAGIGLMTPDQVHYGQTDAIHAARQNTLDGAFNRNPERFVRKQPEPPAKPIATWINPS